MEEEFVQYALSNHKADLLRILKAPDERSHYSVTVNFVSLFERSTELGDGILSKPTTFLPLFDAALLAAQKTLINESEEFLIFKRNIHARVTALPVCPELYKSAFPRNEDINCFLRIAGTVVKRTSPKMLEYKKDYLCTKCKQSFSIFADYEKKYIIPPAEKCKSNEACKSTAFSEVYNPDNYRDYQEIKLQEQICKMDMGSMPKSMLVTLEDDLVDSCKPGDDVFIWYL